MPHTIWERSSRERTASPIALSMASYTLLASRVMLPSTTRGSVRHAMRSTEASQWSATRRRRRRSSRDIRAATACGATAPWRCWKRKTRPALSRPGWKLRTACATAVQLTSVTPRRSKSWDTVSRLFRVSAMVSTGAPITSSAGAVLRPPRKPCRRARPTVAPAARASAARSDVTCLRVGALNPSACG